MGVKLLIKTSGFLMVLFLFAAKIQAQDTLANLKRHQLKAGVKAAGVSATYEFRLTPTFTLHAEASYRNARTRFILDGYDNRYKPGEPEYSDLEKITTFWMAQYGIEARKYYGIKRRAEKYPESVINNSFDFFSFGARYGTGVTKLQGDNIHPGKMTSYHLSWGAQRPLTTKVNVELQLGAAYRNWSAIPKSGILPFVEARLGYVIR